MTVRTEKQDGVWTIIYSRPQARNAMTPEGAEALYQAFVDFDSDEGARVAVLWGEGGSFCSGYDLKLAATLRGPEAMDGYDFPQDHGGIKQSNGLEEEALYREKSIAPIAPMGPSRLQLNKPVIAAVSGAAVAGGMELALWCDMRVMEESAYMGVYCRRWGVPLIDGGTVRLPRLVGEGRALDLILTGRRVDSDEALRIGLCEYVVPTGQARDKAQALAQQIARFPQKCLRSDRESVLKQAGLSERAALEQEWQLSKP